MFESIESALVALGPALTVAGVLLAVWALREARLQSKQAADQAEQLARQEERLISIWGSLSTRYLGQFPTYNDEIAKLLSEAKQRIVMFYDLPGYGALSNYPAWLETQQVIQRKISEGVDFDVTVYGEERREAILRDQMNQPGAGLSEWRKDDATCQKLLRFLKNYGQIESLNGLTSEEYLKVSQAAHRQIIVETFRGAFVTEVTKEIPLYFWMIDDREAILAIPIFSGNSTEYGFRTSDRSLIAALVDVKEKYMRSYSDPPSRN